MPSQHNLDANLCAVVFLIYYFNIYYFYYFYVHKRCVLYCMNFMIKSQYLIITRR